MNIRSPLIRAAGLIALTLPVFAHAACNETFVNGQCIFGAPAQTVSADRTVDLSKNPQVEVQYGDTVKFVNGSKSFTWAFNGLGERSVKLSEIAPQGFASAKAVVNIDPNPLDRH
ncbi:MAG: CzcE family metal-binding protein [Burkholderiaceae bacterium]